MDRHTTVQDALDVIEAHQALTHSKTNSIKALADRAERILIERMLSDYPLPETKDIADKPCMHGVSLNVEALQALPDAWVPVAVIEKLITEHRIAFNRKLGSWQRFQRRYLIPG